MTEDEKARLFCRTQRNKQNNFSSLYIINPTKIKMSSPLAFLTPKQSIDLFNVCWQQWITSLQSQIPALHDEFDGILNAIYSATQNDADSPMYYFQSYTANLLDFLVKRDTAFFGELATLSDRRGIPENFTDHFNKLTTKQQDTIWITLESLTTWVANVYPEYATLLKQAKQRSTA